MTIKDFVCPLSSVKSLEEWLSKDNGNGKNCPPCLIGPLASYYAGALEEAGENKMADELKSTFEKGNALTIAKHMDKIKKNVGDKLKQDLENLDCMAQVHEDS